MTIADGRPVVFGEILFDQFEDGQSVLGGAPFNVAWHLQGFGLNPLLISRVGNDEHGEQALSVMKEWGMDTQGIQIDPNHPTGAVKVSLQAGQPNYDIVPDQAYDFIETDPAMTILTNIPASLIYYGSLIIRNQVSASALQALRERLEAPAFVDINLRAPWWSEEKIESALQGARWVKFNDVELAEITGSELSSQDQLHDAAKSFCDRYACELLIVTCGESGAFLATGGEVVTDAPVVVEDVVDTVGAGDAFSSVMLLGLCHGWSPSLSLHRALQFATEIVAQRGATNMNQTLYQDHLKAWSE